MTFFSFSWTSIQSFRIQLQKNYAYIWRNERDGISAINFEVARLHFLSKDFAIRRRHDNENVKTTIGLVGKATILHVHLAFLYISLPFLHDYDVKLPNFTF